MYSFTSHVRFSEVDAAGRLSIPAIVDLMQDCSTFQSEELGVGPAHAEETGLAWMYSAWEIEVRERPAFNTNVRVSTWATGFKGIKATRNYQICPADDEAGKQPFVRAAANFFMFDAAAGRPIRLPQSEVEPYLPDVENDEPLAMPAIPRKIKPQGDPTAAAPVAVTGAHLDTNHHVNNAQYVSLALGALEELGLAEAAEPGDDAPLWIDVHYSQAAKLGDVICPQVYQAEKEVVVSLDNKEDKPFALVRLHR